MNNILDILRLSISFSYGILPNIPNPLDKGILGQGLTLIPLDIKNNRDKYCYLYKDLNKINNNIYRLGGMSSGFNKKPYCGLIYYGVSTSKLKDANKINLFGDHVIIDINGIIVYINKKPLVYPYYLNGCIAVCDKEYINLKTGMPIVIGNSAISSNKYLFVECKYLYGDDKDLYKPGVYRIEWETGNYKIYE